MRTCPNCTQDTKSNGRRYIITGLVNTKVYECETCQCMFIACDPTGSIWGVGAYTVLCPGNPKEQRDFITAEKPEFPFGEFDNGNHWAGDDPDYAEYKDDPALAEYQHIKAQWANRPEASY